jgi:23S rRNA (pseudouridine1915-N3)-methyltransferase
MKNLVIRAIGRLPEPWQREAIHMYEKRINAFGGISIIELPEGHKGISKPDLARAKKTEANHLLKGIPDGAFIVALDEQGTSRASNAFAKHLAQWTRNGNVTFLIGDSWGLDASVRNHADAVLSFGPMTLPHGLARIVLVEQLYRAKMIEAKRIYHQ